MGKAARWFRALLGLKRLQPDPNPNPKPPKDKDKRRWSFVKSYRENREKEKFRSSSTSRPQPPPSAISDADDANRHAIAVAAATASVAEAAVAAAQAAAAVVRLTHSGRCASGPTQTVVIAGLGGREEVRAAVVIQSYFRGYLARRALRALKGLVKLQALVRGHIMRRKTAETMRCMQAMLRAQARARSVRAYVPESPQSSRKSSQNHHPEPPTPDKFEQIVSAKSGKLDQSPNKIRRNSRPSTSGNAGTSSWSDSRSNEPTCDPRVATSARTCITDEDRSDRILEIDMGKPHFNHRRKSLFDSSKSGLLTVDQASHSYSTSKDSTAHQTVPSSGSCEVVQSLNPLKFSQEINDNEGLYCTAENSPHCYSATSQGGSSRRGPFTPTKSDGSRSFLSGYSECPSYMAYTESSRAKMRSLSAPKQRPERSSSRKRYSVHGLGEHNLRSNAQMVAAMHTSFARKAYPGSGRLDRLGMPVKDSTVVYYSGYLN